MKKINISLLIFLLSFFFRAQAQDAAVRPEPTRGQDGRLHFGLVTGVNNTWIKVDNEEQNNEHYKYKTTFKWAPIGAVIGYKFNPRHDLQMEAYLSKQGQNYTLTENGDGSGAEVGQKKIELTYLQIPLLFKMTTDGETRFNVHFGPQVGFLIQGEETNIITKQFKSRTNATTNPGTYFVADKNRGTDLTDKVGGFNNIDPYIVLGFGLEKDLTKNLYFSGNLRFHYGFKEIRAEEDVTDPQTGDHYILRYNIYGGAQLGLHYIFGRP